MINQHMDLVRNRTIRQFVPPLVKLVTRHIALVHSAAPRPVGLLGARNHSNVFIVLARKIGLPSPNVNGEVRLVLSLPSIRQQ